MEWIDVNDRLPGDNYIDCDKYVLIILVDAASLNHSQSIRKASLLQYPNGERKWFFQNGGMCEILGKYVSHWMPFPKSTDIMVAWKWFDKMNYRTNPQTSNYYLVLYSDSYELMDDYIDLAYWDNEIPDWLSHPNNNIFAYVELPALPNS